MAHPEGTDGFIGMRKGQVILHHRVAEAGGIEIDAQSALFRIFHPWGEMFGFNAVTVHRFLTKDSVARMEIDPLLPGIRLAPCQNPS